MIQTVIFDMDGVIIDTEPVHKYAYYQHFNQLGIEISAEEYATFTGNSTKNIFERLKAQFQLEDDVTALVETKRSIFNDAFDSKEDLYLLDGVEDLIKELHEKGMQLVLASSSATVTIHRIFNRFDLFKYFTHIVSGEDFPKSKPHPAIFQHAAMLSKTPVENCIVIEDSTNGVLAAKAAEIYCVAYNSFHSKMQDYSKADKVIQHFNELNYDAIVNIKSQ